jgi:hypothetical protein
MRNKATDCVMTIGVSMYQAWCAEVARTNQSRNALSTEKQPIGVHVLEKQYVCGVWCEAKE